MDTDTVETLYARRGFDLGQAYAVLLVEAGHPVADLSTDTLRHAAARVIASMVTAVQASLRYDVFTVLDAVRFAWACLRRHIARLGC